METNLWADLKKIFKGPEYDLQRIENSLGYGYPDVSYCLKGLEGHFELKWLTELPKRDSTIVKVEHYTSHQAAWLRRRWEAQGNVGILLKAGREYFYITFPELVMFNSTMTKARLKLDHQIALIDLEGIIRESIQKRKVFP